MSSGRRIAVIGSGGKTKLAAALAGLLGVPHVELDDLNWEPGWAEADAETFRRRVERALARDSLVVDGNYSRLSGEWSHKTLIRLRSPAETRAWLESLREKVGGEVWRG